MEISLVSLLDGATHAVGAVAVIDVFRAFTTAAVVLANRAERIIMVSSVEEALALRNSGEAQICMGEVRGVPPPGFDFGNSPHDVSAVDFTGKTVVQRTSAGTQGIVAAGHADRLYAASLVTARATARALAASGSQCITIVAMGSNGAVRTDEDELCAMHLRNLLQGRPGDPQAIRNLILAGSEAARFHDPHHPHAPWQDVEIALDIDRYDFAIRVTKEQSRPVARIDPASRQQTTPA
jgi:2-phosphosulfolactate phosphatase